MESNNSNKRQKIDDSDQNAESKALLELMAKQRLQELNNGESVDALERKEEEFLFKNRSNTVTELFEDDEDDEDD